jgi:hypothetical protein
MEVEHKNEFVGKCPKEYCRGNVYIKRVIKESQNKGKLFKSCDECKFFKWISEKDYNRQKQLSLQNSSTTTYNLPSSPEKKNDTNMDRLDDLALALSHMMKRQEEILKLSNMIDTRTAKLNFQIGQLVESQQYKKETSNTRWAKAEMEAGEKIPDTEKKLTPLNDILKEKKRTYQNAFQNFDDEDLNLSQTKHD